MPETSEKSEPSLPVWQRPTLTKLSLDETLALGGSNIDGNGGNQPPQPPTGN